MASWRKKIAKKRIINAMVESRNWFGSRKSQMMNCNMCYRYVRFLEECARFHRRRETLLRNNSCSFFSLWSIPWISFFFFLIVCCKISEKMAKIDFIRCIIRAIFFAFPFLSFIKGFRNCWNLSQSKVREY